MHSSLKSDQAAACTGKHKFSTSATAKKVARRDAPHRSVMLHVYRCRVCGFWHVASGNKPRKT